jgi:two-component system, NarL family, sensor kinase
MAVDVREQTSQRLAPRQRTARSSGTAIAVVTASSSFAGLLLALGPGDSSYSELLHENLLNNTVNGITLSVIGALLTWARPRNAVGWLTLWLATANALCMFGNGWALAADPLGLPGRTLLAWLSSWSWVAAFVPAFTVLLVIFPNGRPVSAFGRRLVIAGWTATVLLSTGFALADKSYSDVLAGEQNPITRGRWQDAVGAVLIVGAVLALACLLCVLVHTVRRLRNAVTPEREQLAWMVATVLPVFVGSFVASSFVALVLNALSPIGIAVGILKYRLFDIKIVLRRGLVYGLLTMFVVVVYAGVVAGLTELVPHGVVPSVLAAASVALLVRPVYDLLQGSMGRLVYGDRDDPVRALTRIGEGMRAGAGAPSDDDSGLLPLARAVSASLRSPYAALATPDGDVLCVFGDPRGLPLYHVALEFGGQPVGRLTVGGRSSREPLRRPDQALIQALAGPVATAVHAVTLADELRSSRERLIDAREVERQRIRQDLHDGLGPSLSGVALGLEAARTAAASDPERLMDLLAVLHDEVDETVSEVRRVIDDLGPAALGGVGLVNAVRAHAEAVSARAGLEVIVEGPDQIEHVPPPIEVAAYRIVLEAVTNAVRHAHAGQIRIEVRVAAAELVVSVEDDGVGIRAEHTPGVGLASMRRRAESVGGSLAIVAGHRSDQLSEATPTPGEGTRVVARLPLGGRVHG